MKQVFGILTIKVTKHTKVTGPQIKRVKMIISVTSLFKEKPNKMLDMGRHMKGLELLPTRPNKQISHVTIKEMISHRGNSITLRLREPGSVILSLKSKLLRLGTIKGKLLPKIFTKTPKFQESFETKLEKFKETKPKFIFRKVGLKANKISKHQGSKNTKE